MTVKELSQLQHLNKEIDLLQKQLMRVRSRSAGLTSVITGMPHSTNIVDRTGATGAELADLESMIESKQKQCIIEYKRIYDYILAIPDSHTRSVFTMRFIEGMSWNAVAMNLHGYNTADGVRKIVYRYVAKHND